MQTSLSSISCNAGSSICMQALNLNDCTSKGFRSSDSAALGQPNVVACWRKNFSWKRGHANSSGRSTQCNGRRVHYSRPNCKGSSVRDQSRCTLIISPLVGQSLGSRQALSLRKRRRRVTSAVWQDDAPFIIGIGVTIAITAAPLIFPVPWSMKAAVDEKKRFNDFNTLGDEDTKFTAMAVISFLPLFNWLAWVLAWLDSSDPRYALYAAVYLAPWLKSGLDFTDSWLPLGAVALGAAHVQLERYVQSEGPVRSLPTESEQPAEPKKAEEQPGAAFDDRGWAANVQEKDLKKLKPLSEEEIRRREEKWELKRWDQRFAERLEAETAAEEALPQKEER